MLISIDEVRIACAKLRNGRACAEDGIISEMLKTEHAGLLETCAKVFTAILRGDTDVPASWRGRRLSVIYKKGNLAKTPACHAEDPNKHPSKLTLANCPRQMHFVK